MTAPVTVAITRRLDPDHESEMVAWLEAGTSLVQRFPGFLGSGWLRPDAGSDTWHVLFRFVDAAALAAWEGSPERRWWRASATALGVEESRVERVTGIEGWFDDPATRHVEEGAGPSVPPRWKQACAIFLVFLPLSVLANEIVARTPLATWAVPLRVLAVTAVLTPLMTYVGLPWITRRLEWWLHGRPAPWRHGSRTAGSSGAGDAAA